ncbi:PEP-CTERM sorting domain-containing protein [Crocosphaera watsonii]
MVCPGEPLVRVVGQQEVPSVPEPSTVISLLALGGLSLGLKGKGSKKQ